MNHLLDTKSLSKGYVENIYELATFYRHNGIYNRLLLGKNIATLFQERSTRTRSSFQLAAQRLGACTLDISPEFSSLGKGETLEDTIQTLEDLDIDCLILRHRIGGAAHELVKKLPKQNTSIINAGDGMHEHPTQALVDLYTIRESAHYSPGQRMVIVGDVLHSRVARSNIWLLKKFGIEISVLGPPNLAVKDFQELGVCVYHHLEHALCSRPEYIMTLRVQNERLSGSQLSLAEYKHSYRLDRKLLNKFYDREKLPLILHPGPVNREVEISSDLVDDKDISLISQQVYNGLYIRMAVMANLINKL